MSKKSETTSKRKEPDLKKLTGIKPGRNIKNSSKSKKKLDFNYFLESPDKSFFSIRRIALFILLLISIFILFLSKPGNVKTPVSLLKNTSHIMEISWKQKGGSWKIMKIGNGWSVTGYSGSISMAQTEAVSDFIYFLDKLKGFPAKLPKTNELLGNLSLKTGKGKTKLIFYLGKKGKIFLKSHNKVFVVLDIFKNQLFPPPDHFVDTLLFHLDINKINKIMSRVTTVKGTRIYHLHKSSLRWKIGKKAIYQADSRRIISLLHMISKISFRRIIENCNTKPKSALWKFSYASGKTFSIYTLNKKYCPPGEKAVVREGDSLTLPVCISKIIYEKIKYSLPDLMEAKLLPKAVLGKWENILIKAPVSLKLKAKNNLWSVNFKKKEISGDMKFINDWILSLNSIFISGPVKEIDGLKPAFNAVFSNAYDKWIIRFFKDKNGGFFVKRADDSFYYRASTSLEKLIPYGTDYFKDRVVLPLGNILKIKRKGLGLDEYIKPGLGGIFNLIKPVNLPVSSAKLVIFGKTIRNLRAKSWNISNFLPQITNPKADKIVYTLTISPGTTAKLTVFKNFPVAAVKIPFLLSQKDHEILKKPWVLSTPFPWNPLDATGVIFKDKNSTINLKLEKGFWVLNSNSGKKILTKESVKSFFKNIKEKFNRIEPLYYSDRFDKPDIEITLLSDRAISQVLMLRKSGDFYLIKNKIWPVIWKIPEKRVLFLLKQFN